MILVWHLFRVRGTIPFFLRLWFLFGFQILTQNAKSVKNQKASILVFENLLHEDFFDELSESLLGLRVVWTWAQIFDNTGKVHTV